MDRRLFLTGLGATLVSAEAHASPLAIGPGPHLFLDDYLIAHQEGLRRVVRSPNKVQTPVLENATFGTTQPYLSVVREPKAHGYRMWYNHGPAVWHATSADGVRWRDPRVAWDIPRGYCCSVVDDGAREPDPSRRFKMATWQSTKSLDDGPRDNGGLWVGFSPDGFAWIGYPGNPVLRTWPEGYGKPSRYGVGDTCDVFWDPQGKKYGCAIKVHALKGEFPPGPKAGSFSRRLVGYTTSTDFVHWSRPERILVPDEKDEGLLEFYGMGSLHQRGGLTIGLARILRDDLPCDPGGPPNGIGYSVLVITRDGKTWHRFLEPFLDRSHLPGAWDHAMAWASAVMPVRDELFIYYGGYARGHKIEAGKERQIGLARMKRDRYAALTPVLLYGSLRTPPFWLPQGALTLNVDARGGEVLARVLDAGTQKPLRGLDWYDVEPISIDSLAAPVRWNGQLARHQGRPVVLEFQVHNASLFAMQFGA